MTWVTEAGIQQGVIDMLKVNMGLDDGERLLIVSDYPAPEEWRLKGVELLQQMVERTVLARMIAESAAASFPDCRVRFWPFVSTGKSGTEPDDETALIMQQAEVLIALTTHSLSHTNARQAATAAGVRVASMPDFEAEMFLPGGAMAVDYKEVAANCQAFAKLLTAANSVRVVSPQGTDMRFSLHGRDGQVDDGLYDQDPEHWGNLPAGEAFAIPVEGTGEGVLVVSAGWHPQLRENMTLEFRSGEVIALTGGGDVGRNLHEFLWPAGASSDYGHRRNLAEFGIGTNPNAKKTDIIIEAEKIKGTVHLAIGDNIHMGGRVESDMHEDFILPEPDVFLDGTPVILGGKWNL